MPELPEVETVKRVLQEEILNLNITNIDIFYPQMIENDKEEFINIIKGSKIVKIDRIGKYLLFRLNNDYTIISHLRMEGKFYYQKADFLLNKHMHVVFYFDNGYKLIYQDVRKFGKMKVLENDLVYKTKPINKLGLEPFDCNKEYLYFKLKNKNIPIKTALLDQTILLGLGNIYVDEVLFKSKILPTRLAKDISLLECQSIIDEAKNVLLLAIEKKGTTIKSYTSSLNVTGQFQDFLCVHTKKTCKCGCDILKIKINGRTSYYCKNCQR